MEIRKIFEYALQREHEGLAFYNNYIGRLHNAAAIGAFKTIAAEEQKHIDFIQEQLNLMDGGKFIRKIPPDDNPKSVFFADRAENEHIEQSVTDSMVADLPVLRMAYLIERDFAEFYNLAASKLAETEDKSSKSEATKVLEMLARWEAGHERLFKRMHDQGFEKYAKMP